MPPSPVDAAAQPALWHRPSRALWLVLAAYAGLALAYSFAQPPFEPSDEQYQFGYVRYLVEQRALPVARLGERSLYHHPPLFFALAAAISWPFPTPDLPDYDTRINPYARFRHWEPSVDNKNLYLHGPWDAWPFHDTSLAVRVARLASLAAGAGAVLLTYQLGRSLSGEAVGLAAAGLVAFTPMFTSLSGAVQNDIGATAAGAATLWLGLHAAQAGFTLRRAALLGVAAGLAALMKITGAFLLPPAALLVLAWAWQCRRPWRQAAALLVALGAGAALAGGWWYARNWLLYGDPTAVRINLANWGGNATIAEGLALWPAMLPYAWTTFWARIGHGGIVLPGWVYQAVGVVTLVGSAGLIRAGRRAWQQQKLALIFLAGAGLSLLAAVLIYVTLSPTGGNGRYAYPALPAYMALLALGLLSLAPPSARERLAWALAAAAFAFSLLVLVAYVWPAYAPPPQLPALPAGATPLDANLGDTAQLRGFQVSASMARPGDRVYVTLYWEPLSQTDRPYSVYLHLLDGDNLVAQRDTYPGLGRNPTTAWQSGRMFADTYLVLIPDAAQPARAEWKAGLWQADTGDYAFLLDASGQPVDSGARFGGLRIEAAP